jgi:mannose-6-phosphate isomerase-like protein (cupin superfamily)
MKTINYKDIEVSKNPHGVDARKIHDNENVQVVHILLKPGEQLKKHSTAVDVFFYILEGNGIVEIGDKKMEVSKDFLIDSPKDIPHCLYNESEEIFRVLVVKTPKASNQQNIESIQNMLNSNN